jgi:hypothetical protein
MFITGLNRFFERHGRKTFAVFTALIIVSFVLYFAPGFDITQIFGPQRQPDESLPPDISKEAFQSAVNSNLILISMQLGKASLKEQFVQQMAYYKAPDWAISKKIAEERGFKTDDKAIFDKITEYQIFKGKDGFDKNTFNEFIKTELTPFGFNSGHIEEAIRGELAQNHLQNAIKNSALSSNAEANTERLIIYGRIKAKLFVFTNENFIDKVETTNDELLSYFNANKKHYFTEAQSKAITARFNNIDFEKEAETLVSDKDIEDYYTANKAKFTTDGTTKPLDDLRKSIKETLVKNKAAELAANKAQVLAIAIYQNAMDSRDKSVKDVFTEDMKKSKIPLVETDWFNEKTKIIKNVGIEPEFAAGVSALIMDQPISDVIRGQKATFVALLIDRQERRPAEFDEVKDIVTKDFRNSKAAGIASQKASETALAITEKLTKDIKPDDIAELKSPNVTALAEFSIAEAPDSLYSALITELSLQTAPGKLSEIRHNGDASIFIFVEAKNPPQKNSEEDIHKYQEEYNVRKKNLAWFNFMHSTKTQKHKGNSNE